MHRSLKATSIQPRPADRVVAYQMPAQDTRSLRQKAVEALRTSILQGHLKPGDRLRESEIAGQMGISRGPVREALRELERDGLVVSEPYRETVVADISMEDVREILVPLRRVLEARAVREAVPRLTAQDLTELDQLIAEMRVAGAQGDVRRVVDADVTFHQTIVRIAGNRYALHIWETLSHRIRTHFYRNDAHYVDLRLVADEHVPLLEALRGKNVEHAVATMEQHLHDALTLTGTPEDSAVPIS